MDRDHFNAMRRWWAETIKYALLAAGVRGDDVNVQGHAVYEEITKRVIGNRQAIRNEECLAIVRAIIRWSHEKIEESDGE